MNNKEVTYDSLNKRDISHNLQLLQSVKEQLVTNDKEFSEAFYLYVDMEDFNTAKEIKLKNIKKVLHELSIKFGYDMEPAKELINVKHSHLNGISYPIFKECLFEWLEKQEKIYSTTIFIEERDVDGNGSAHVDEFMRGDNSNNMGNYNNEDYNFTPNFDVDLIILHRSLYILKRKFEIYDKEISDIYKQYANRDALNKEDSKYDNDFDLEYCVNLENGDFLRAVHSVLKSASFSIADINKPSDLYRVELVNQINRDKVKLILKDIEKFANINREKYNKIMKERIEKKVEISRVETRNDKNGEKKEDKNEEIVVIDNKEDKEEVKEEVKEENIEQELKENIEENEINEGKNEENIERENNEEKENQDKEIINTDNINTDYKVNILPPENKTPQETAYKPSLFEKSYKPFTMDIPTNFLLIEILPLIIADYVQEKGNTVIIDINPIEELKHELRTLFDNEILQRLGESIKYNIDEEKTAKLKDLLLERLNLEKNVRVYEDLLVKKIAVRENTVFIEQMLKKLKKSKIWLENKIKLMQEDNDTVNNFTQGGVNIKNETIGGNPGNNNNTSSLLNNTSLKMDESSIYRKNNVSKIIPKKYLSKEEIRSHALKEIFYFYSRQHHRAGKTVTFDDISNKLDHMDMGEFMKFCVEFKILVKKEKLMEVFKKTSNNTRNMTYDEFLLALRNISVKVNDEKKELLMKRINRLRNELKKFGVNLDEGSKRVSSPVKKKGSMFTGEANHPREEEEEMDKIEETEEKKDDKNEEKNEDNENEAEDKSPIENNEENNVNTSHNPTTKSIKKKLMKKQSLIYSHPLEIQEEIPKFKMMLQELKNKSYQQLLEEFYLYLEIDNTKVYRNKMKGFILPFHSHDKDYKIPGEIPNNNKKLEKIDPRTAEEIKRILQERKEEKEKMKEEKERMEKLKYFEQRKKLNELNQKMKQERERVTVGKDNRYAVIKQKQENFEKEKDAKLTWDQLESLNSNFFISNREDDFNAEDLIGDDDYDSDDVDLYLNINRGIGGESHTNTHNTSHSNAKRVSKNSNLNTSEEKIYNYNNATLVQNANKTNKGNIPNTTPGREVNQSIEKRNKSPTYASSTSLQSRDYHDHSYFLDKTQKKIKEIEKEWEEKQVKIIEKYDNMVKKSQEKVNKHKSKKY